MAISPQTDLFLVKCPLQLSNKHQLTFASKDAQFNYFHSLPRLEVDNISYIRKDNVIRYPGHIDSLLEYNYCYYQNEILYPKDEDMPKVEYYHDIAPEIRTYYENLWIDVKLY